MQQPITRRQALAGLSALLLLPACSKLGMNPAANHPPQPFAHGVASGDPDLHSVVLWTRITTTRPKATVIWEVSEHASFNQLVASGRADTDASRDFTLKVLAEGLHAGKRYFYRFRYDNRESTVGKTQTLASGELDKLGIAIASCSNYPFGYFNAYDAIAKDEDIDIVLHLGDYIYEYGSDGWGAQMGQQLGREHQPSHEIVSLTDYRQRHAQYKQDESSQRMHAAHPLIPTWDDHESTNNPWMEGAQNHQPESEGAWPARRTASVKAYYEWMPIREPSLGLSREQYWRHFQFGNLASMVAIETRHTGRALQIDYADHIGDMNSQEDRDVFMRNVLGQESRDMLSKDMESFLQQALTNADQTGTPWKIIANQIPMARTHVPVMDHAFFRNLIKDPNDPVAAEWATMVKQGELNLPIYLDTWDGYPAARERFYQRCQMAGCHDLLVLTGDSHAFWQNQLFDDAGQRMGVELGTTGISSPGDFLRLGVEGAELLDQLVSDHNPEVVWTDNRYNGYIRLRLTPEQATADYVTVSTVLEPDYTTDVLKQVVIRKQDNSLVYQDA